MSGFTCIFHRDGRPASPEAMSRMLTAMAHRGPDGIHQHVEGPIAMGHCLLATTPQAVNERMPAFSRDRQLMITGDLRLDDRAELWRALGMDGTENPSIPDSQLVLAAYEKWGEKCPEHLLGDFAFVIWDDRMHQVLFARDHAGVRPLFYSARKDILVIASEATAIINAGLASSTLNHDKLANYLVGFCEEKEKTVFEDIIRLLPANSMRVGTDVGRSREYWSLHKAPRRRFKSDQECLAEFKSTFIESVRRRMISISPPFAELSGGVDSTGISCVGRHLAQLSGGPSLRTVTNVFPRISADHPETDEFPFVQDTLVMGGFESTQVDSEGISPLSENVLRVQDFHLAPNMFLSEARYAAIGRTDSKVVLSGHDGDTVISHGVERLAMLLLQGRWLRAGHEIEAFGRKNGVPPRLVWRELCLKPIIPETVMRSLRTIRGNPAHGIDLISGVINPDFKKKTHLDERMNEFARSRRYPIMDYEYAHAAGICSGTNLLGLEFYNQMCGLHGLEPRFPFFDRQVMEFCVSVPLRLRLEDGGGRHYFREALKDLMPDSVRCRHSKGDLATNFRRNLFLHRHAIIEEPLAHGLQGIEAFVDVSRMRAYYQRLLEHGEKGGVEASKLFWGLGLHHWLRQLSYVESPSPSQQMAGSLTE